MPRVMALSSEISGRCNHRHSPCVEICPPGVSASWRSWKYGFWKRDWAGPTGSEESVMMTSYVASFSARNLKPSPMNTLTFGEVRTEDMCGRYCLETRTTACSDVRSSDHKKIPEHTSSMSQSTTCSTVSCLSTSRTTPPSPPPITRTFLG